MFCLKRITGTFVLLISCVSFLCPVSEACEIGLCEQYCENGFYEVDTVTPSGYPCHCQCCPAVVCRHCFMRKKIVAPDSRGCMTCKCGWYF